MALEEWVPFRQTITRILLGGMIYPAFTRYLFALSLGRGGREMCGGSGAGTWQVPLLGGAL